MGHDYMNHEITILSTEDKRELKISEEIARREDMSGSDYLLHMSSRKTEVHEYDINRLTHERKTYKDIIAREWLNINHRVAAFGLLALLMATIGGISYDVIQKMDHVGIVVVFSCSMSICVYALVVLIGVTSRWRKLKSGYARIRNKI